MERFSCWFRTSLMLLCPHPLNGAGDCLVDLTEVTKRLVYFCQHPVASYISLPWPWEVRVLAAALSLAASHRSFYSTFSSGKSPAQFCPSLLHDLKMAPFTPATYHATRYATRCAPLPEVSANVRITPALIQRSHLMHEDLPLRV